MATRWQKLNYLIPEPQCRMKEDVQGILQIIEWEDARPQPTDVDIDAVTEQDVIDSELDNEAQIETSGASKKDKLLFEINYDQEERLRVLEGAGTITKQQYKDALVAQYKTL